MFNRHWIATSLLLIANAVFAQDKTATDVVPPDVVRSDELTRQRIGEEFPDVRVRLNDLMDKMRRDGVLSLPESDVVFIARDKTGQVILAHLFTRMEYEFPNVNETTILSEFWRDVVILSDLLPLQREDYFDIFTSSLIRKRLIDGAELLTVGNSKESVEARMNQLKGRPLLKPRILDFLEGEHTRTRQYARKLQTPVKPAPVEPVRPPVENLRLWTSKDGKFTTEAAYKGFEKGIVTLEKKDYSTIDVPLDNLSPTDRAFVQKAVRDSKKK